MARSTVTVVALDAAGSRLSVAARSDSKVAERHLDGARGHGTALINLVAAVLEELGTTPESINRVLLADGPGSFTGLRISAAFAKAVVWSKVGTTLAVAPHLMLRAISTAAESGGGLVLAASSALRGEIFAGWYRVSRGNLAQEIIPARALGLEATLAGPQPDLIVGDGPDSFLDTLAARWGVPVIGKNPGPADAKILLALDLVAGQLREVDDFGAWEPQYGRPAEAQAVWERKHGRPLIGS